MTGSRHLIEGDTFDQIFEKLLFELSEKPQFVCSPRGSKIKENLAVTLVLNNPRARLLSATSRATNYGFGVGEFLWYWAGRQDLEAMLYYNKRMKDFSDDGKTLNSAYGHRMRRMWFRATGSDEHSSTMTQWEACLRTLIADPDSRRAIMLINLPGDEVKAAIMGSKDVPCTLSLQFFIRDGKLDLHVHMRSNDVIWGLTYDLFSFTLFQECMLLDLKELPQFKKLELGTYYHTAGSLHLYERHFEQAVKIVEEYNDDTPPADPGAMAPIPSLEKLGHLVADEENLREGRIVHIPHVYEGGLEWMAKQLNEHRDKRDAEAARK